MLKYNTLPFEAAYASTTYKEICINYRSEDYTVNQLMYVQVYVEKTRILQTVLMLDFFILVYPQFIYL